MLEREYILKRYIIAAVSIAAASLVATTVALSAIKTNPIEICHIPAVMVDDSDISNNLPTRNNNPGNIRKTAHTYLGETNTNDAYETFADVSWGFAAMFDLLERKYSGKTINEAISIYAPDFENDTNGYVKFIGDRTGLDVDAVKINVFNLPTIIPIVEAMARMEGGKNWTMEDLYLGWIRWAGCSLPAR